MNTDVANSSTSWKKDSSENIEDYNIKTAWNKQLEDSAKNIGENCKSYKIMHLLAAQKSKIMYSRLTILGIALGPLSSVISSMETIINDNNFAQTIKILGILAGFISGIVVAIIKFGKYDEESTANKHAAARYTSIENNVRRQLSIHRKCRVPANVYMQWLETKFEELFLSAPLLPSRAYDSFFHVAKKLDINVPIQYNATININKDIEESNEIINNHSSSDVIDIVSSLDDRRTTDTDISKKEIKRTATTLSYLPHLNQYSDTMLQYEMNRMLNQ